MLGAEESPKAEHQSSLEGLMERSSRSERTLKKADLRSTFYIIQSVTSVITYQVSYTIHHTH